MFQPHLTGVQTKIAKNVNRLRPYGSHVETGVFCYTVMLLTPFLADVTPSVDCE